MAPDVAGTDKEATIAQAIAVVSKKGSNKEEQKYFEEPIENREGIDRPDDPQPNKKIRIEETMNNEERKQDKNEANEEPMETEDGNDNLDKQCNQQHMNKTNVNTDEEYERELSDSANNKKKASDSVTKEKEESNSVIKEEEVTDFEEPMNQDEGMNYGNVRNDDIIIMTIHWVVSSYKE